MSVKCYAIRKEDIHTCSVCQLYRENLRVMRWHSQQCDSPSNSSRTSHNNHTNIQFLNVKEMEERLRKVPRQKRKMTAKYQKLEEKMKKDIDENGIPLTEPEADIVEEDATGTVEALPRDSVQYILWKEQKQYNALKDKCHMRWHPVVIRFALNLKYAFTVAYHDQQVTKLGFLA